MKNTILVIEDNEQNMYLVTFLLEAKGFEVLQARSGEDGLLLAEKSKPDLILLDIQLPLMDGYDVARRLKSNNQTSLIPIVAVTSYAMAGDRTAALAAGCEGYIEKPIDPNSFVDQISKFLLK